MKTLLYIRQNILKIYNKIRKEFNLNEIQKEKITVEIPRNPIYGDISSNIIILLNKQLKNKNKNICFF